MGTVGSFCYNDHYDDDNRDKVSQEDIVGRREQGIPEWQ